ncbi:MAG: SDR family NAD(P)-dependent oxidoreductase [Desulfobacter sp.]
MEQNNKVALITGAGRGIGKATALRLAKDGYSTILLARTESQIDGVAAEIREMGQDAVTAVCDVASQANVNEVIGRVCREVDAVDVLVNCAGRGGGGHTREMDDDLWHEIIAINLHGVYYVTKAVLAGEKMRTPGGSIINIASTGGKQGVIYAAAYCSTKHAVVGFSKSLGLELAGQGITVNAVCPGFVETDLAVKARQGYSRIWQVDEAEAKKRIEARVPIGRYIMPEEVADMVAYVASDSARGITAQAINICGGLGNY